MNVSLTDKQKAYISEQIQTGDYQNASELVRDALRLHQLYRMKVVDDLHAAIAHGWNAPDSTRSLNDILSEKRKHQGSSDA